MAIELKLPLLGDVMREGTLASWLQADGARVQRGEPLYQLETDKVSYAVEAPASGILKHAVAEGSVVLVGAVVGRLLDPAETEEVAPGDAAGSTGDGWPGSASQDVSDAVRASPAARRLARQLGVDITAIGGPRRLREADVQAFHDAARAGASPLQQALPAISATPAARRLAREKEVDLARLNSIALIRTHDVQAFERALANAPLKPDQPDSQPEEPAIRDLVGRRRVIADRMHTSLQEMAQLTVAQEVDFTDAARLRQQLKQLWPAQSWPTITDLVIRACVLALSEHPSLNATLDGTRLAIHSAIHLGLAVDAEEGLIVPVVRSAETMRLGSLAERTRSLAARARANQIALEDLQGGTFTVTSLGHLGIDFFTPIVNPPQVAILGIGRVFEKLAMVDGRIEQRAALYLNLSFDHRAIDGAPAARFLNAVKRLIELPASLVL